MLHKKSFFLIPFTLVTLFFLSLPSEGAVVKRTRKFVCKRGFIRITTINGVKKYSCVVKKKIKKAPAEPNEPFFSSPLRWQASWWGRVSVRTGGGPTLASNRYRGYLEGEQDIYSHTRFIFGARATHDLMSNIQGSDYRDDYSRDRRPELELWNIYTDSKYKGWRFRFGQQQVAWGETFGFFYADLVNPKDLRERSLGRLSELRLPVPMANVQWATQSLSVQFLYLPFFSPDRYPTPKSDFFPQLTGVGVPRIDTTSSFKLDDSTGDFGGRISGTIKGVDIALLYFNYIDRQPYYTLVPVFDRLLLQRRHNRIQSTGLTFSTELEGGWIIRSENVYTPERTFSTIEEFGISETKSVQRVHVLGIDAPKWEKLHMGLQLSNDVLIGGRTPFQRPRETNMASLRLAYDLPEDSMVEALITEAFGGNGELIQATYTRPISDIHELEIYWDQFHGDKNSFFGQTERASRIYIGFRGAFNG